MTSYYITENWKLDGALRDLHDATAEMKTVEPMRLHGDAHFIWDDICDLIELLGKVTTFVPDEKITAARLMLESLDRRKPAMQAAE
jgi:hypothetical protein